MEVQIVFKLQYDRTRDGSLTQFRDKYHRLRAHIDRLQALGQLPRGDVKWSVEHKKPEPPQPTAPARVAQFHPDGLPYGAFYPVPVHRQGTRLDPERIAI